LAHGVLEHRIRDWDQSNLFFQAVLGLASLSESLGEAVDGFVPGKPPAKGHTPVPPDHVVVLALLGALRVKGVVDAALADALTEPEGVATRPTPTSGPSLREILR
jgi:hypothetical protein